MNLRNYIADKIDALAEKLKWFDKHYFEVVPRWLHKPDMSAACVLEPFMAWVEDWLFVLESLDGRTRRKDASFYQRTAST